jgi:hypothetical protein
MVLRGLRSVVCTAMIVSFGIALPLQRAQAAAFSTGALVERAHAQPARARVLAVLGRAEVARELQRWGVDPAEARDRVAALSDAEIARVAARLDQLPAGADTAGAILLGLLIGFAALVITDMLGWTDVFPSVGPAR